jgi:amyloid beta precursor protein binding protein 1
MATTNKYDRQLRLWGANGQKALSESCIILINATSAGTETLKNLVLPGIGSFHIIDDQMVDGGNGSSSSSNNQPFSNFFVFPDNDNETKSKSRAEIATKHLSELNPDVKGSYTSVPSLEDADYKSLFKSIEQSLSSSDTDTNTTCDQFIVVAADLPSTILKSISNCCWGADVNGDTVNSADSIPLVIVKSYGLIGTVRLQTPHHPIIESKPDNSIPDLRLASLVTAATSLTSASTSASTSTEDIVFPELLQFIQSIDLKSMEDNVHGHVPFVIILFKAMEKWLRNDDATSTSASASASDQKEHQYRQLPKTFSEKQEFKKMIQSMSRNYYMELNFQEAVDNASLVYTTLDIPPEVEELVSLAEKKYQNYINNATTAPSPPTTTMTSFDIMVIALKRFMDENKGFPPLNGSIPDMTASTNDYINLQNIYKTKAQQDEDKMRNIIQNIRNERNDMDASSLPPPLPVVTDEELSIFCKNVYNLRHMSTRSYTSEYDFVYSSPDEKAEILQNLIDETYDPYHSAPAQTPMLWFIALRAADAFHDEYGYYPGKDSRTLALESDARVVQEKLKYVVGQMSLDDNELLQSTLFSKEEGMEDAFAKEITRYYNAEIHNIASIVGGVASQEAVKLITKQYVPMSGTYVYNGIAGTAGVYTF